MERIHKAMENYQGNDGKNRRMGGGVIAIIIVVALLFGTVLGAGIIHAFTYDDAAVIPTVSPTPTGTQSIGLPSTINPSPDPNITGLPNITAPPIDVTQPFADIFEKLQDTVVLVTNFANGVKQATGSGVIFTTDGYIITNYHVIEDSTSLTVTMHDETELDVDLVGGDEKTDLAVLKIRKGGDYHAAALGTSSSLRVGEYVLAIGSPLGYSGTLTHGIVSALDRAVDIEGKRYRMIQTDCFINPGNSGGPLFNLSGEVIGITSMKEVYTATSDGEIPVEGIGYAIPIDTAKSIVLTLMSEGEIKRGAIGVVVQSNIEDNQYKGVAVIEVTKGGAADKAGIKVGDIIIGMDGVSITKLEDLSECLSTSRAGDTVSLKILRNGAEQTISVVLMDMS